MRAMIGATLVFARDDAAATMMVRLDLASLIDSLVYDLKDTGAAVESSGGPRAIVRGDSGALRRLFANLVENAMRYGERATVGWTVDDGRVTVTIDDIGPGIDPALAEHLFQPFVRGDPSRNRMTGGTGLGLAIVRTIATAHGGAVTLGNGPTGAQARVVLPLSA
ncbi:ATP-binding protein [Sphingomonas sp. LR60]|uniref:sensor histidine kinase n=1 Tax=Sphingomonas sp. LR60 TaxID=3050233 RepID=UPI002FE2E20F